MPQTPYTKMAPWLRVVALRNQRANQPRASNSRTSSQVYIDKLKLMCLGIWEMTESSRYHHNLFFVVLALSLHSLFEGLAIGLEESIDDVWTFFIGRIIARYKLARD